MRSKKTEEELKEQGWQNADRRAQGQKRITSATN